MSETQNRIEHVKNVLWVKYPQLKEMSLDGHSDYARMKSLLIEATGKVPDAKAVYSCMDALKDEKVDLFAL